MKIRHILSAISLTACAVSIYWLLQKPKPIAPPQNPALVTANAQSFQNKLEQLERARLRGQSGTEIHLNSDEVNAAVAQATATMPATTANQPTPVASTTSTASQPAEQPTIKDYQLGFDGDVVKGQFLAQVAGKDIYVTVAGHLGARDGYATFEPTQFKVGEMSVPVSLVNEALQKKLAEQRDQLKLPDYISDLRVENGELVMKEK
jgi:hypothetical protein